MNVGEMQRKLSQWAERDKNHRFFDLYHLLYDKDWLRLAHDHVKENAGSQTAGSDGVKMGVFDERLDANLAQLVEELKAGAFEPQPVRRVYINKTNGKFRPIGISAIQDRIVQEVLRMILEPIYEAGFSQFSFGFRPNRCTTDAIKYLASNTIGVKKYYWAIEGGISSYFDSLCQRKLMKLLHRRVKDEKLLRLIGKFLRSGVMEQQLFQPTTSGVSQGNIVSPLLTNLFLHYAFDLWMQRNFLSVPFERYADDILVHCKSEWQAKKVLEAIRDRFMECGLELHPTKTKIVYCQDSNRRGKYEHITFDFLGYTFQPRRAKNRKGKFFVGFLPAISNKAAKAIRATIRDWRLASTRNNQSLEGLAKLINPAVRGWMNYYGRHYRSKCELVLRHVNRALAAWVRRKYKRFRYRKRESMHWLGRIAKRDPNLFVLWQLGVKPEAGS